MRNEEIDFIDRPKIIDKINHFAGRGEPFLFAIDFAGERGFVLDPGEATGHGILYEIGEWRNHAELNKPLPCRFDFIPVNPETYQKAFEKVQYHLKKGDTYLLNLTFQTILKTGLGLREFYAAGRAPFSLFVPGRFVVFSPEPFVMIRDGKIISCPMKGTISADVPDAEIRLLGDKKEFFEHNTIVDLIRNDLSMVSTGVKVSRFRYIDRIHTNRGDLLQMSSEICGNLPSGSLNKLGEILFTLLPAGSVTGAPKGKTVQIIRETENYERGFYTGIFGYFNGNTLTSAVSIRFIEDTGEGFVFKSGGGITALSEMESEYNELIAKVYVPVI